MDNTPKSYQNSSESGYFDSSHSLFESTPNAETNSTPLFPTSKKRKASFLENYTSRKLTDVMEVCPSSPPFSSTFNESFINHLEQFRIQSEESSMREQKDVTDLESFDNAYHSSKIFRINESNKKKIRSAPNTPEKQIRGIVKRASTNSFVKNFSQINMQSPLHKEAYNILYPDLPPLEPCKKPLTPQKLKDTSGKVTTPAKKCLFRPSPHSLFKKVFSNNVIVGNIFKHLSSGDLYRLSMVSQSLKDSLRLDKDASERYKRFVYLHKGSKENYRITPPKSPPNDDSMVEASPGSKNFYYFCGIASELNKNQSLTKCLRCGKASVVENSIAQCQDVNKCGYIFCLKCNSFAYNPSDFKDKCNNAQIVGARPRSRLGDLSNSTTTSDYVTEGASSFFSSSLNLSISNRYDSSGFFSECEPTTPVLKAKRNLSKSFTSSSENKPRALSLNNDNRGTVPSHKLQRRSSTLPVIPMEGAKRPMEIIEPSSPPKVKPYSACSKQSKKNLKRLTR